jgi:hypothetical protein
LVKREADYRSPPSGSALRLREAELAILLDQLEHVIDNCPPHLCMDTSVQPSPRYAILGHDLTICADLISDVFEFPDTLSMPRYDEGRLLIREEPRRAFIIQQANIHITRVSGYRPIGAELPSNASCSWASNTKSTFCSIGCKVSRALSIDSMNQSTRSWTIFCISYAPYRST